MKRALDRLARHLGYVRASEQNTGVVEFKRNEQPFVNLELPGGQRVYGWVDSRTPGLKEVFAPPNPSFTLPPNLETLAQKILAEAAIHRGPVTAAVSAEDAIALTDHARKQKQWDEPKLGGALTPLSALLGTPLVIDGELKPGEFYTVSEETHIHTAEQP